MYFELEPKLYALVERLIVAYEKDVTLREKKHLEELQEKVWPTKTS